MHTHKYVRFLQLVLLLAFLVLLPKLSIASINHNANNNNNNNVNTNINTNINNNNNANNGWHGNPPIPVNNYNNNQNYNQNNNVNYNSNSNSNYNYNAPPIVYSNNSGNYNSNYNANYNNNYNGNYNYNNNYNNNYSTITVQTLAATNIYNNSATLNGYLNINNNYNGNSGGTTMVWFQWGITTSYGSETSYLQQNNSGPFSQVVSGLVPGYTYHYRAAAKDCYGNIVYGQDMTFYIVPQVIGASYISTGLTNNFLTDSFFLPLMLLLLGIWILKSKKLFRKKTI